MQQSFVINGDGFVNQTITVSAIPLTAFSIYTISDNVTFGIASGQQGNSLTIGFPGNTIGNFNVSTNSDVVFTASVGANTYIMGDNFTVNVTQYGNVGGKITGTFSGDAKRIFFNELTQTVEEFPVTITNGIFELQRNPDQE